MFRRTDIELLPRGNKTLLSKETTMTGKSSERNQVSVWMPGSHPGKTDGQEEAKDREVATQRRHTEAKLYRRDVLPAFLVIRRQISQYHNRVRLGRGTLQLQASVRDPSSTLGSLGTNPRPRLTMTPCTAWISLTEDI